MDRLQVPRLRHSSHAIPWLPEVGLPLAACGSLATCLAYREYVRGDPHAGTSAGRAWVMSLAATDRTSEAMTVATATVCPSRARNSTSKASP